MALTKRRSQKLRRENANIFEIKGYVCKSVVCQFGHTHYNMVLETIVS